MVNGIVRKVDEVIARINTHPEYSLCTGREKYHALREEAEKHSLDIELLNEGKKLSLKERAPFLARLNEGFDLLARDGVGVYTLSKLGSLVEPENNPTGGLRNQFIAFGGFNAPNPEKVPYRIQHLTQFLQNPNFHPIVRAANAHLEMIEIHPYMDGNGRSARLLQNFCLQERNYPPAVILASDLKQYVDTIHNALRDRYSGKSSVDNPSIAEKQFHDFISNRVLISAHSLENELKKRRMYEVEITKVNSPGMVGSIAKMFRGFGKSNGHNGVSVSIKKENGKKKSETLRIVGDIGKEDIENILSDSLRKLHFNYSIKIDYC